MQIDVIICVILWFKFIPSVSISFVITDNTSPFVLLSKYFIGNLFIFTTISFLNLYVTFCAILVIVKPWTKENNALTTYNPNNVNAILPILSKLIPSPPFSFPIKPLYISVVAFPNIFGPIIVNIVLPIANIITIKIANLYLDKYEFINVFVVFLKSFAFSVVEPLPGPPIGPGILFSSFLIFI